MINIGILGKKKKDKIYEDIFTESSSKSLNDTIRELQDDPEKSKRGEYYSTKYMQRIGEMQEHINKWEKLQNLYSAEREVEYENAPNSFISVITPIIEGQAAAMTSKPITAKITGREYSDQQFASTGQSLVDFVYSVLDMQRITRTCARRYGLFGNAVVAVSWNPDSLYSFGSPEFRTPLLSSVIIDGKVKNQADMQQADWIIEEMGFKSIAWIARTYGEDVAGAVEHLNNNYTMGIETSADDKDSVCLLHVWTKNNEKGNLQLIEMDKRGFIFRESDPDEPFYKFVDNKYPFFFAGEYELDGQFYHFGDGKLIEKPQETINKLWDELETTAKFASQPRTFVDPKANMDTDELDNDPSHPIMANNPTQNVWVSNPPQLSTVLTYMVKQLVYEVQRIARYSDIMNGISPEGQVTATEICVQHTQGNVGINDKRSDISQLLSEATKYALGLMMEFWESGKTVRITGDSERFEWVDARDLKKVPMHIPSDEKFKEDWRKSNKGSDRQPPDFMLLEDAEGNPQTRLVDFDIKVNVGEGLPNSKIAIFNMILSLARIQLPTRDGQLMPIVYMEDVKPLIEELVGLPLGEAMRQANQMQPQGQTPIAKVNNNIQPLNFNENVEGFDMMNNPLTGGGVVGA